MWRTETLCPTSFLHNYRASGGRVRVPAPAPSSSALLLAGCQTVSGIIWWAATPKNQVARHLEVLLLPTGALPAPPWTCRPQAAAPAACPGAGISRPTTAREPSRPGIGPAACAVHGDEPVVRLARRADIPLKAVPGCRYERSHGQGAVCLDVVDPAPRSYRRNGPYPARRQKARLPEKNSATEAA